MSLAHHLSILGGGVAGLAAGYYARRAGIPLVIYEAEAEVGGLCRTARVGHFRFDLGAHRFHDKIPEVTTDLRALLGPSLATIDTPSAVSVDRGFVRFPLAPLDLARHLGVCGTARAGRDLLRARLAGRPGPGAPFGAVARHSYGETIARRFVLDYSSKLWGVDCDRLAPDVGGARLRGLTVGHAVKEFLLGRRASVRHVDGSFCYPSGGIGAIPNALAAACGDGVRTRSVVTRIVHAADRVTGIEVNGGVRQPVDLVLSTLPIDRFLHLLDPPPPRELRERLETIRYRALVLVVFLLDRPSVTSSASVYFPDPAVPFTRVSEPRNRCGTMSPPGRTSLVVELPCAVGDERWSAADEAIVAEVRQQLVRVGWLAPAEGADAVVRRVNHAYPVIEQGVRTRLQPVYEYLAGFENLALAGRNASFEYTWMHLLLRRGRDVAEWARQARSRRAVASAHS